MRRFASFSAAALGLLAAGCASTQQTPPPELVEPRLWNAFDGASGDPIPWAAVEERALAADVILVGEQHDDARGHELQRELVEALLTKAPNAAVAMEMFERDEQTIVDFYLDGRLSEEALIASTGAENWGGSEENWRAWYQPIVDAAKARAPQGARVIAANAPRGYVKLARLADHQVLTEMAAQLPQETFVVPDPGIDDQAYREQFVELMGGGEGGGHGHGMDLDAFFRAQQLWDATMADAVLDAQATHPKVILLAGDFHVANQGGTTQRIRQTAPQLNVLTISMQQRAVTEPFDREDAGRADVVIYTLSP